MSTQTIKPGDIVRLTDPLDNGTIVRIENVDENGFAEWLGGSQNSDMEQIDLIDVNSDLIYYYHSLSELVRHIEEKTGIKLYPESAVEYWKHRAEVAASKCDECGKEHAKLAEWLTELQGYKDETPINTMWLQANGFNESGFVKIGDSIIRCYATGRNRYFASVDNDERNFHEQFGRIKTIEQFKMFLTLCGVQDFVKQLK